MIDYGDKKTVDVKLVLVATFTCPKCKTRQDYDGLRVKDGLNIIINTGLKEKTNCQICFHEIFLNKVIAE